ncbi:MAG: DNA repair protein RadA [Eubacteriales bacterium]
MKANKTVYTCTECGYQSPKWLGRCPSCQSWNCFEEEKIVAEAKKNLRTLNSPSAAAHKSAAVAFSDMTLPQYMRSETGMGELDRVLGGGLVTGSVVLLAGEPGIGKSTLLTQICGTLGAVGRVLYVSGEESRSQIKLRAKRLGIDGGDLFVLTETDIDLICAEIDTLKPQTVIVDSIQTVSSEQFTSVPGSVTQVKEAASKLINKAKNDGISIIIVGHVNKEGSIAGPKVLEHMVDAVLYFEGERQNSYRLIRAVKNRFGSTNEIGVFEMTEEGLREVPNPSEMLLADRPKNVSGNCAVCVMEGTRPVIAEVQALVSQTAFPSPKRTSNGIDYNRLYLLLAVLEKRLGLRYSTQDVYMNVIGGLRLDEPAADLSIALSLISGLRDLPIPDDLIAVGEVGLAGECRAISNAEARVSEAARLGFTKIILPARSAEKLRIPDGVTIIPVRGLYDMAASKYVFPNAGDR